MWWLWLVIPLVSGLVGWGTNWLAIQMTFYPLEFWPLRVWQMEGSPFGLFGWQGIIPAKAGQMAVPGYGGAGWYVRDPSFGLL